MPTLVKAIALAAALVLSAGCGKRKRQRSVRARQVSDRRAATIENRFRLRQPGWRCGLDHAAQHWPRTDGQGAG